MAKRKILILAANPKNSSLRRLDREVRDIEAGMKRSKLREEFEIVTQLALRTGDIQRALLDEQPAIVHFAGQGAGANGLIVEDKDGKAKLVSTQALARLFKFFKDEVECVVLNACYSEEQAEAIREHIGYVVGVDDEITNRQVIQFATGFYDALGAGRSYEDASEMGRIAVELEDASESVKRTKIRNLVLINLGFLLLLVLVRFLGGLQVHELKIYDILMQLSPNEEIDDRIAIIGIERSKLEKLYDDPQTNTRTISDLQLARIINLLVKHQKNEGKPDIIGIDIARDEKNDDITEGDFHDNLKTLIVSASDRVVSACALADQEGSKPIRDKETGKEATHGFSRLPDDNRDFFPDNRAQSPTMIRRQLLAIDLERSDYTGKCQTQESFSFKIALRFLKKKNIISEEEEKNWREYLTTKDKQRHIHIENAIFKRIRPRTGGYQNISSGGDQIILNYRNIRDDFPKSGFNSIDAVDFLECRQSNKKCSDVDILEKADIVLIGYVGENSEDEYNTPIGYLHGVEIHAHTLSYILSKVISKSTEDAKYKILSIIVLPASIEDFSIILFGLTGGLFALISYRRPRIKLLTPSSTIFVIIPSATLIIFTISYLSFGNIGLWLPVLPWILSFTSSVLLTVVIKEYQIRQEE